MLFRNMFLKYYAPDDGNGGPGAPAGGSQEGRNRLKVVSKANRVSLAPTLIR